MADKFKPGDKARIVGCVHNENAFLIGQEVTIRKKIVTSWGIAYTVIFDIPSMIPLRIKYVGWLQEHLEPITKPPTIQELLDIENPPDFEVESKEDIYEYVHR
jgi:hypothetical protein